jgi:hypothetical protein
VLKFRETNWFDITQLLGGTATQRSAAKTLINLRVFELLEDYTPALCGTVPIDCDIAGSDLDVICQTGRLVPFEETLRIHFGELPGFSCRRKKLAGVPSVVARFFVGGWRIEIIGQTIPVPRQRAFAHMLAEALLLSRAEYGANESIRELKRRGLTTEESFGELFSLPGDPYEALTHIYESEIATPAE